MSYAEKAGNRKEDGERQRCHREGGRLREMETQKEMDTEASESERETKTQEEPETARAKEKEREGQRERECTHTGRDAETARGRERGEAEIPALRGPRDTTSAPAVRSESSSSQAKQHWPGFSATTGGT